MWMLICKHKEGNELVNSPKGGAIFNISQGVVSQLRSSLVCSASFSMIHVPPLRLSLSYPADQHVCGFGDQGRGCGKEGICSCVGS